MTENYVKNREKSEELQDNYRDWKIESMSESGYFLIFKGFLEDNLLKDLSGNALKLYIYLGINSNNFAGVVWHSNRRIAEYFNKSERTIRVWMKELEDKKLLKRMRLKYNGMPYTFLLPYKSDYNDKYLKMVEGPLINKRDKLYIKIDDEFIPISSGMYLEIYDNITSEWIFGRIYSTKNNSLFYDENFIYYFKAINEFYEKQLSGNIDVLARAMI